MESIDKNNSDLFSQQVEEKARRKLDAQRENKRSAWFGLGMFGMVGWSVAVPTLLGAALGIWLDKNHHESFSWTLSFLILGLFTGCMISWHWIAKERKEMDRNKD